MLATRLFSGSSCAKPQQTVARSVFISSFIIFPSSLPRSGVRFGFIDCLDVRVHAIPVVLGTCFGICRMEMLYTFFKVSLLHRILHHGDGHDVHSGSSESNHCRMTYVLTNPSKTNGSCFENASAASRVLNIAMFPPSPNGPIPRTTPCAMNLSTSCLWCGYTAMIASLVAPADSPITTYFITILH